MTAWASRYTFILKLLHGTVAFLQVVAVVFNEWRERAGANIITVACAGWAEDDPFFLTLKIRYQKDQTYYGQPYYWPGLAWPPSHEQETLDTICLQEGNCQFLL